MMGSPDPFSEDHDANDSFDNFLSSSTIIRRRSQAIVSSEEESIDGFACSDQITVIENQENDTILIEDGVGFGDERVDLDDTITRMLDSSDDEEGDIDVDLQNDALANLLKSFREGDQQETCHEEEEEEKSEENMSNVSIDVFGEILGNIEEGADYEDMTDDDVTMLPIIVPNQEGAQHRGKKVVFESFTRFTKNGLQRRMEYNQPSNPCQPSTSAALDGPAVVIGSDTGEYWNQPKTINIHGQNFEINSFNDYMRMKITKLNHQVNSERSKPQEKISDTLKGYSVFVNGYTDPPALVIRDLMMAHGGEYHCYYQHGITTYTIASSIATAKISRIREKEIFIKADWITESIAVGKPLDYRDFLIYEKGSQEKGQMAQFLTSSKEKSPEKTTPSNTFLDARNPNFIRDYYARSRLHLISTLAQDMKDFVSNLKREGKMTDKCFPEEDLVKMGQKQNKGIPGSIVFHVDLDCFFVSVAVRDRTDLKDKEVAITHSKGTISNSMSEIASCSYGARNCGVKNGMLVRDALQKCPQLTLLPYQFDDYVQVSRQIYQILASYTLELRAVSCDEMYINMSSLCEKNGIGNPVVLAEHIRRIIREKTRCPASVGIGSTSLLARLATRHAKPDGVFWVTEEKKEEFLKEEKIRDLPGLGYEMMNRLTSFFGDMVKCSQLQQKSERELIPVFGPKLATKIYKQCRGIEEDPDDFWKTQVRKSVSCDINYGIRFTKKEELIQLMTAIGAELERKLTGSKLSAGSITLKLMVRSANAPVQTSKFMGHGICDTFTKTCNITGATNRGDVLTAESMKLYAKVSPKVEDLRGVGVTCGKLKSRLKKDTASVILEMFGKGKKEANDLEPKEPKQKKSKLQNIIEEDEEDVDRSMHEEVIEKSKHISSYSRGFQRLPHPSDIRVANEIDIPGIVKLSKCFIKKTVKTYAVEEKDNVDLCEKYLSDSEVILQKQPTEDSISQLYEMLSTSLNSGKLLTFQKLFLKFEKVSMDSHNYHVEWFSVFQIMLPHFMEESKDILEFPIDPTYYRPVKTSNKTSSNDNEKKRIPREIYVVDSTNESLVK